MDSSSSSYFLLRRILGIIVIVTIAAVFFYSAWSKLTGISSFEWTFIQLLHVSGKAAAILARAFIGLEALLGALLLAHLLLKSFTYKAIIGLLVFFCIYLVVQLIQYGNSGNCGCFGDKIYMSPLAAIIKNVAMIAGIILLWKFYPAPKISQPAMYALPLAIAAFTLPFTMNRIRQQRLDFAPVAPYTASLSGGRHVVAFLSLTCPHCRKAGAIIAKQYAADTTLPYFIILGGNLHFADDFWKETGARAVPHYYLQDMVAFKKLAGDFVPAVYWEKDGIVERNMYYEDLDAREIKSWTGH